MDSPHRAESGQPAGLAAALDELWARFLPDIRERIAILESAAAATAAGNLTSQQQQDAQAAAHKLIGILGTFGLDEGTSPARETERLYTPDVSPTPETGSQLVPLAASLRLLVEGRKPSPPPAK
jgi:HPt (histidine-containing phosphotransfer) domain-containing protein